MKHVENGLPLLKKNGNDEDENEGLHYIIISKPLLIRFGGMPKVYSLHECLLCDESYEVRGQ